MIDTHIHTLPPRLPGIKPMPESYRRLMESPLETIADRLKEELRGAGLTHAFGMGRLEAPADDPLGVNGVLRLASLVPGLRAIGAIDPRKVDREHLAAVERQIERGRGKIVALKGYLGYLHFGPDDPNYVPYYKLAAKHALPVILHTGDTWSTTAKLKYAHPLRVDEAAVDHPDVKFVMAHLGNPWLVDAAEVIYKNENVWADLSGLYVGDAARLAAYEAEQTGFAELRAAIDYAEKPDRFIYGSDWPLAPMSAYRKIVEAIVPKEQHENVFDRNARGLFKIEG